MTAAREPSLVVEIPVRKWVESSNIGGAGYDAETKTLEVVFVNGGRYRYGNVEPAEAAPLLLAAPPATFSPGKYLSAAFVKDPETHPFVKVAGEPVWMANPHPASTWKGFVWDLVLAYAAAPSDEGQGRIWDCLDCLEMMPRDLLEGAWPEAPLLPYARPQAEAQ